MCTIKGFSSATPLLHFCPSYSMHLMIAFQQSQILICYTSKGIHATQMPDFLNSKAIKMLFVIRKILIFDKVTCFEGADAAIRKHGS